MKKFILLLLTISTTVPILAQKKIPAFGKIEQDEIQLSSCKFEPGAGAVKLFDVQEVEFDIGNYSTRLTTERRVRIKIFNETGYKHASIRIPYFGKRNMTKIKDLSGAVYNTDASGKVVVQKLEKKDFFREKPEDNVRVINFTFPNLKPGSIIEFRYTKIEKDMLQIDPWIVQDKLPVEFASNIITVPSDSRIKDKTYGADSVLHKTERFTKNYINYTRHIYTCGNIKSFDPEPFMSSATDNLLRTVFLLIPNSSFLIDIITSSDAMWKLTGANLMSSRFFGGQIRKTIPGTEGLIDSAKKIVSLSDRIRFLYESVQKRIPEKTEQTMYPDDITEAWKSRNGNTAEINLILLNLLKKADITALPLLVSTRSHGKINMTFPSSSQFDGVDVICVDSNKLYIMDASLKYQLYNNPPLNILNRIAFLLDSADMRWVTIDDERQLLKQRSFVTATFKEEGILEGNAKTHYYNYAKSNILDTTTKEDEGEDDFIDKKTQGLKIISVKQEHTEADSLPLEQHINFTYEPQTSGDFYFINPQFLMEKNANPFTKTTRNTDIDFGCNQHTSLIINLNIPPGYQLEQLPKNITVRAPDSIFFFKRTVSSDSSFVNYSYVFEIQRALFDKEEYPGVKEFFSRIYALMAEEIIIKKRK
jgi:hypothetical protein